MSKTSLVLLFLSVLILSVDGMGLFSRGTPGVRSALREGKILDLPSLKPHDLTKVTEFLTDPTTTDQLLMTWFVSFQFAESDVKKGLSHIDQLRDQLRVAPSAEAILALQKEHCRGFWSQQLKEAKDISFCSSDKQNCAKLDFDHSSTVFSKKVRSLLTTKKATRALTNLMSVSEPLCVPVEAITQIVAQSNLNVHLLRLLETPAMIQYTRLPQLVKQAREMSFVGASGEMPYWTCPGLLASDEQHIDVLVREQVESAMKEVRARTIEVHGKNQILTLSPGNLYDESNLERFQFSRRLRQCLAVVNAQIEYLKDVGDKVLPSSSSTSNLMTNGAVSAVISSDETLNRRLLNERIKVSITVWREVFVQLLMENIEHLKLFFPEAILSATVRDKENNDEDKDQQVSCDLTIELDTASTVNVPGFGDELEILSMLRVPLDRSYTVTSYISNDDSDVEEEEEVITTEMTLIDSIYTHPLTQWPLLLNADSDRECVPKDMKIIFHPLSPRFFFAHPGCPNKKQRQASKDSNMRSGRSASKVQKPSRFMKDFELDVCDKNSFHHSKIWRSIAPRSLASQFYTFSVDQSLAVHTTEEDNNQDAIRCGLYFAPLQSFDKKEYDDYITMTNKIVKKQLKGSRIISQTMTVTNSDAFHGRGYAISHLRTSVPYLFNYLYGREGEGPLRRPVQLQHSIDTFKWTDHNRLVVAGNKLGSMNCRFQLGSGAFARQYKVTPSFKSSDDHTDHADVDFSRLLAVRDDDSFSETDDHFLRSQSASMVLRPQSEESESDETKEQNRRIEKMMKRQAVDKKKRREAYVNELRQLARTDDELQGATHGEVNDWIEFKLMEAGLDDEGDDDDDDEMSQ